LRGAARESVLDSNGGSKPAPRRPDLASVLTVVFGALALSLVAFVSDEREVFGPVIPVQMCLNRWFTQVTSLEVRTWEAGMLRVSELYSLKVDRVM
jgi:hypothetical protein